MKKNTKVLVVDDNKEARLLLSKLLTSNNFEVKEACNGIEALQSLKASKTDLIISDILMPEMDGFTLIRELNKDISGGKIPVVLYSAQYVNEKDKELAEKLGASGFITKPAEPKDILKEIKKVIAEFESSEQKHVKPEPSKNEAYLGEYAERVFMKLEDKVRELEHEIKERKIAEESLKLSEKKYRDLFENANDAICIVDANSKFKDINTKTVEITGYSKEELLKMGIFDLIPLEQAVRSNNEFKKLKEKGHYEKFPGKIRTKSGNLIDVEVNSSAIIEDDRIIGSRDILRDITERKKAEMAIKESEARLTEAQGVAHIGNWEWKPKTNELYWSDENYRIFGLDPNISPSIDTFFNIIHPDDLESVKKNIDDALNMIKSYNLDIRIIKPDGSKGNVHAMAEVDFDEQGNPSRMYGTVQDVTERKKTEEDLSMFKLGIERSNEAVFITHIDGRIIYINPAFEKIYGFSREETFGKKPNILKSGLLPPEAYKPYWDMLLAKKVVAGELINKTRDGRFLNIESSANPILNDEGELIGFLAIQRDITERKHAEEKIAASLKEKEILLREIHHRVKNNMQVISSLLVLTSGTIKDKKYVDMFLESQNRIYSMSLIHEKLYQSRDLAKIELNEYIRDLANAIFQSRGVKTETILLNINIENIPLGIDHAIPLGLIFNELITNSLKYAFPGGRKGEIKVYLHLMDENTFELIVSDNGVGIPYDMDFRKTESLGLRLVTILVENQLKGKIDLYRSKGTEFIIKFQGNNNDKK